MPGVNNSYKELRSVASSCPEMTGDDRRMQELPGAARSYQSLPEAQDLLIATQHYPELTRTAKSFQDLPRTTSTCEVVTRGIENAKSCQELLVETQISQRC